MKMSYTFSPRGLYDSTDRSNAKSHPKFREVTLRGLNGDQLLSQFEKNDTNNVPIATRTIFSSFGHKNMPDPLNISQILYTSYK